MEKTGEKVGKRFEREERKGTKKGKHGKRDAGKTFGAMTYLEADVDVLVRSYSITKNRETKNRLEKFFIIKYLNLQT